MRFTCTLTMCSNADMQSLTLLLQWRYNLDTSTSFLFLPVCLLCFTSQFILPLPVNWVHRTIYENYCVPYILIYSTYLNLTVLLKVTIRSAAFEKMSLVTGHMICN